MRGVSRRFGRAALLLVFLTAASAQAATTASGDQDIVVRSFQRVKHFIVKILDEVSVPKG